VTPLEEAILRTVIYADLFNFPLNRRELHHYLIAHRPYSPADVEQTLKTSLVLKQALEFPQDYVICAGRQELLAVRAAREAASLALWSPALRCGEWLARLPFVRMVALTGALAVRNASNHDDDLDYVLVTAAGRVWLARAFAILLVRLGKTRGVVICPNYVLAASALEQEKQDLFMAHEVAQMVPLYGLAVYTQMRGANRWVESYLPNAALPYFAEAEYMPRGGWNFLKRLGEWALGGRLGDALERWEYQRKLRRFADELRTPNSAALLDDQHVKGHFQDHGHPVMQEYARRLRAFELDALPLAGD
jgi:hypothetical protein